MECYNCRYYLWRSETHEYVTFGRDHFVFRRSFGESKWTSVNFWRREHDTYKYVKEITLTTVFEL